MTDDEGLSVLLVTPDYPPPPGGIQTIVKNLEQGLEDAGHRAEVLHVDPESVNYTLSDYVPTPKRLYSARSTAPGQFRYLNAVQRRTNAAIERCDPDVVHAMHIRCWPALSVAAERGLPTVLSTYALELEESVLAANAIADADVVHAISEFTASLVREGARSEPTVRIIPPSIDVGAYQRVSEDVEKDGGVVALARFVDRKNIETVIRAWKALSDDARADRALFLAGDGPNRDRLEGMVGPDDDIEFLGWVNGEDKQKLLARADAFALVPRRDEYDVEGFGIVYIEAQAAGTPVVGSKHGGAPEAIGDAGIVVDDENDPAAVADALETLLTDERVRDSCLDAASGRVEQFDVPAVARSHVTVYRELLGD
jgi:phosphatidylinositol alpha-1,6-mannosyltransferase